MSRCRTSRAASRRHLGQLSGTKRPKFAFLPRGIAAGDGCAAARAFHSRVGNKCARK
jgi:hypothetical protein